MTSLGGAVESSSLFDEPSSLGRVCESDLRSTLLDETANDSNDDDALDDDEFDASLSRIEATGDCDVDEVDDCELDRAASSSLDVAACASAFVELDETADDDDELL